MTSNSSSKRTPPPSSLRTCVLGSGPFGTALSNALAENCAEVRQWGRDPRVVEQINEHHENGKYLPGIRLSRRVRATLSMAEALDGAALVLLVLPSHVLRKALSDATPYLRTGAPILTTSKSIEAGTLFTMSELFRDSLPAALHGDIAVLSGPSFAKELAQRLPTVVTLAASSPEVISRCQAMMQTSFLRLHPSLDQVGVQIGAALKNVIAIGVGICDGLGLGANMRAAFIALGLEEIGRLAARLGGEAQTLGGLSGLGDLVLTATGTSSRSWQVGAGLAKERRLADILKEMGKEMIEGATTAASVPAMVERWGVELPLCRTVHRILDGAGAARSMRELQDELFVKGC